MADEADDLEFVRSPRRAATTRRFQDILQLLYREAFTGRVVIHFYRGKPKKVDELGVVRRYEVMEG